MTIDLSRDQDDWRRLDGPDLRLLRQERIGRITNDDDRRPLDTPIVCASCGEGLPFHRPRCGMVVPS